MAEISTEGLQILGANFRGAQSERAGWVRNEPVGVFLSYIIPCIYMHVIFFITIVIIFFFFFFLGGGDTFDRDKAGKHRIDQLKIIKTL